jgi:DNA-binding transcriptional ArsR family regulator
MGDPSRLKIMLACLDAPICVGDIAARTGLSLLLASHHLRLLRSARILRGDRRGKRVFYTATGRAPDVRTAGHGCPRG